MHAWPSREGLRLVFREPWLGVAEIAWRWTYAGIALALIFFLCTEYLDSLPVSEGDLILLRSGVPWLVASTIRRLVVSGSERFGAGAVIVFAAATATWIFAAATGRAATLKPILGHFRPQPLSGSAIRQFASLVGIHVLRAALFLGGVLAWIGAPLLATAVSPAFEDHPAIVFLLCLTLWFSVGLVWSALHRILSIAPIFVIRNGLDTFGSVSASIEFVRAHLAEISRTMALFTIIHLAVFLVATSIASVPLPLVALLPGALSLAGMVLLTLAYCGIVDFLYVAKLAAYVCILESSAHESNQPSVVIPQNPAPSGAWRHDEDDILSDVPGLVPPAEPA